MRRESRVLRFGPFEADLHTGELRRDGVRVRLQQQPFRLLRALLDHPGELVTREELRRTLWPDGTFVAFERGLTSAMRKVREALGDRADTPTYIETLPGRGYRFIVPVTSAARPIPPLAARGRIGLRLRWGVAFVAAIVMTGGRGPGRPMSAERLAAAESLSSYACLLKSQGRFEEALAVIRRAQALAPESAKFTAEVGFYLHAAGRYDDEFPMLYRAIQMDARSPDAWFHLGLAHARRQDFQKAVESLERAGAIATDDARVRGWLHWARLQDSTVPPRSPRESAPPHTGSALRPGHPSRGAGRRSRASRSRARSPRRLAIQDARDG
jgi:DNA-binding winged helix-turn-helix (wHTH) protein